MALVRRFEQTFMERNSIHEEIRATYTVFEHEGRAFIQIDTYGRPDREMPGKKSQSIQLDRAGAEQLFGILKQTFNLT